MDSKRSNNTNKLSPQELFKCLAVKPFCSNNTNKLSPQELQALCLIFLFGSNNTNKLSPQEHNRDDFSWDEVQIIQINLVLKNLNYLQSPAFAFK